MKKYPISTFRKTVAKVAGVLFVVEGLAFVGAYGVWHKMNTSRDFRYYMYNNHNWALEMFYKCGEFMSSTSSCRKADLLAWTAEEKTQEK
ncbi:Uncharacterized protein GBIM_07986 [Gryllus bimaculatus]|nr:Uncharacterized protein GBIM_07986 [Gryllus bimaculatus]